MTEKTKDDNLALPKVDKEFIKNRKAALKEFDKKVLILQDEVKKLKNRNQLARALLDEGII